MRPKKRILLAGDNEERAGLLGYVLRTHGYNVLAPASAAAAEQIMLDLAIDLLLIVWPLDGAQELMKRANAVVPSVPTLVVSDTESRLPLGFAPDMTRRSLCPKAEILECVKLLTARKRGPRLNRV